MWQAGVRGSVIVVACSTSVFAFDRPRGRPWAIAGALALALSLTACGGDDDESTSPTGASTTAVELPPDGAASNVRLRVALDPEQTGTVERPSAVRIAVDMQMQGSQDSGEAVGQSASGGGSADPDDAARAGEADDPPVRAVDLEIPAGVVFQSDELEACAADTLAEEGPDGCPRDSRIGTGTITAASGTIDVEGQATAVYRGDDRVALWVQIANPVSVGEAIEGQLEPQSRGGYRLKLAVPESLQEVAGLPVSLQRLQVRLGRGAALATTDCPDGGLPFAARMDLGDGVTAEGAAKATCR